MYTTGIRILDVRRVSFGSKFPKREAPHLLFRHFHLRLDPVVLCLGEHVAAEQLAGIIVGPVLDDAIGGSVSQAWKRHQLFLGRAVDVDRSPATQTIPDAFGNCLGVRLGLRGGFSGFFADLLRRLVDTAGQQEQRSSNNDDRDGDAHATKMREETLALMDFVLNRSRWKSATQPAIF